jgi:hypothetical protein
MSQRIGVLITPLHKESMLLAHHVNIEINIESKSLGRQVACGKSTNTLPAVISIEIPKQYIEPLAKVENDADSVINRWHLIDTNVLNLSLSSCLPLFWMTWTLFKPSPFFFVSFCFSLSIYIYFPHFCSSQLIFLYSLLCRLHPRVIVIILFEFFYNKDHHTNSSSSLHSFIIIDLSPCKTYFREVDCAPDIVDQGRFIVIFQLTLVRGQENYRPIARGPSNRFK